MNKDSKKFVEENFEDFFTLIKAKKTFETELLNTIEEYVTSKYDFLKPEDKSAKYRTSNKRSYVVSFNSSKLNCDKLYCSVAYNDEIYDGKPFGWIALGYLEESARAKFIEKVSKVKGIDCNKWTEGKLYMAEVSFDENANDNYTLEAVLQEINSLIEISKPF